MEENLNRQKERVHNSAKTIPKKAILWRLAEQGLEPHSHDEIDELRKMLEASRHSIAPKPSADDPAEPLGDMLDVGMHPVAQDLLDALQGSNH